MSLYVVSRRKVVFQQASLGAVQVVYVPSADQTQVLKDSVAPVKPVAKTPQVRSGVALVRLQRGQRVMYGTLPNEIQELRQSVKVWLPEDLVPPTAEAFFFVFSPQVVIHGIRERNDEGKMVWRTAQLQLPQGEEALPALQIIFADYSLANPGQEVCLAVVNDVGLYRAIQQGESAHGYSPVPFSTLKPQSETPPLYSHANFTWVYLLLLLIGIMGVLAVAAFWLLEANKVRQIKHEITTIEAKIQAVQINQRTGHIRQPDAVLRELTAGVAVSPSALMQAAGDVAQRFGEVRQLALAQPSVLGNDLAGTIGPEVQVMQVAVNNPTSKLLVDQAATGHQVLAEMPWVRQLIRQGSVGGQALELLMLIEVTGMRPAPVATNAAMLTEQPQLPTEADTPPHTDAMPTMAAPTGPLVSASLLSSLAPSLDPSLAQLPGATPAIAPPLSASGTAVVSATATIPAAMPGMMPGSGMAAGGSPTPQGNPREAQP